MLKKYAAPQHPIIIAFLVVVIIPFAGAPANAEIFGVSLDSTCLIMLKNNISSACPSYEEIMALYPDNSNPAIFGKFEYKDNYFQRLYTKIINVLDYYRFDPTNRMIIDPPAKIRDQITHIEIRANFQEFRLSDNNSYDKERHAIILGQARYIEECDYAYINAADWIRLLGDTINYMHHDCDSAYTGHEATKTTLLNKTDHDISSSYKWKLEQWIKAVKNNASNTDELYYKLNG